MTRGGNLYRGVQILGGHGDRRLGSQEQAPSDVPLVSSLSVQTAVLMLFLGPVVQCLCLGHNYTRARRNACKCIYITLEICVKGMIFAVRQNAVGANVDHLQAEHLRGREQIARRAKHTEQPHLCRREGGAALATVHVHQLRSTVSRWVRRRRIVTSHGALLWRQRCVCTCCMQ